MGNGRVVRAGTVLGSASRLYRIGSQKGESFMSMKNSIHPLVNKNTNHMEKRTAKIAMRVGREGAITRGWMQGIVAIMRRPFLGRMKWLVLGS